jgi:hypothetical protein
MNRSKQRMETLLQRQFAPEPEGDPVLLELVRPEKWSRPHRIEVSHMGGVLVRGENSQKLENSSAASIKAGKWKSCSRRIREAKT